MFKNFDNFIYSSENNFPKDECVIQDERELDVFHSEKVYLVIYISLQFEEEKMVTYAKPYIWKGENGEILFGWTSTRFNTVFGNVENSCQFYDEFVIGFIPVDNSYIESDEELFNQYKQTINAQLED